MIHYIIAATSFTAGFLFNGWCRKSAWQSGYDAAIAGQLKAEAERKHNAQWREFYRSIQ
jgi:hypothetical protein